MNYEYALLCIPFTFFTSRGTSEFARKGGEKEKAINNNNNNNNNHSSASSYYSRRSIDYYMQDGMVEKLKYRDVFLLVH